MKTIEKKCLYCKEKFNASLKEHNRGNARYCCISCSSKARGERDKAKIKPNVICETCKKYIYKSQSKLKNSKHGKYFCSRACKDKGQRIGGVKEIQPPHYGTASGKNTYRSLAFKLKDTRCETCNYDKYKEVLQVHHKDRDRNNNKIENLKILCPTCHMEKHYLTRSGIYHNNMGD